MKYLVLSQALCILLAMTSALIIFGCGSGSSSSTIDQNATVTPTYSSINSVILSTGCTGCHGGSGGYSFDNYTNTMAAVVAGNADASPLYTSMTSGQMPKSGNAPSSAQLQAVRTWINSGAPNN